MTHATAALRRGLTIAREFRATRQNVRWVRSPSVSAIPRTAHMAPPPGQRGAGHSHATSRSRGGISTSGRLTTVMVSCSGSCRWSRVRGDGQRSCARFFRSSRRDVPKANGIAATSHGSPSPARSHICRSRLRRLTRLRTSSRFMSTDSTNRSSCSRIRQVRTGRDRLSVPALPLDEAHGHALREEPSALLRSPRRNCGRRRAATVAPGRRTSGRSLRRRDGARGRRAIPPPPRRATSPR